jgi:hypothetical protein
MHEDKLKEFLRDAQSEATYNILSKSMSASGLKEVIENASGFAEAMTKRLRQPESPSTACKKGCHWCCHQLILVSPPEAFRIIHFMKDSFSKEIQHQITNALQKRHRKISGLTYQQYYKSRLPCAFQDNYNCIIYPVRPLVCAGFSSYDVADCKSGRKDGLKPNSIEQEEIQMIIYRAVHAGLFDGLKKAFPSHNFSPLELTSAVIAALRSKSESSWLSGKDVFEGARFFFKEQ